MAKTKRKKRTSKGSKLAKANYHNTSDAVIDWTKKGGSASFNLAMYQLGMQQQNTKAMLDMTERAIETIDELMNAKSETVRLKAAQDILNRTKMGHSAHADNPKDILDEMDPHELQQLIQQEGLENIIDAEIVEEPANEDLAANEDSTTESNSNDETQD